MTIDLTAKVVHEEKEFVLPIQEREGWDHALLKLVVGVHLLTWGYSWESIHWEDTPPYGPAGYRADVWAEGKASLPFFWFECRHVGRDKLEDLVRKLPTWRIVNVIDVDSFRRFWSAQHILPVRGEERTSFDWERRLVSEFMRDLVRKYQAKVTVPGAEYWAARIDTNLPDLIYAVRRERNGEFTYLDTGEGWSLDHKFFFSKRLDRFEPIIPGRVGSGAWRGESRRGPSEGNEEAPRRLR